MGKACQDWPASGLWSTRVPGEPAIQTLSPRTARAAKSNCSATASGSRPRGICQCAPRSAVSITRPPWPTIQPKSCGSTSATSFILARPRRPNRGVRAGSIPPRRTVAAIPLESASTPWYGARKSPAAQPAVFGPGSGFQLRPPSSEKKTPEGYIPDEQPIAQPCRGLKNRICLSSGKGTWGLWLQWRPPSLVESTTPVPVWVYGWE